MHIARDELYDLRPVPGRSIVWVHFPCDTNNTEASDGR